jgi:glycosyltransferase involved in cell wall biosynthesis
MRILYVSPYAPERCGIGDYTAAFARTVRAMGHDVGVVSTSGTAGAPDEVMAALPSSWREVDLLRDRIEGWDPDVVHVEFAVASYGTRIPVLMRLLRVLRPLRAQVVVTLHEVTRDTDSLRIIGRAIYRRMVELADRVVVHTDSAMAALTGPVGANGTPAELVPHPRAELPEATASQADLRSRFGLGDARVLLAFGFIHVDKGLDDLVNALHLMRERKDVKLVVAGDVRARSGPFKIFELRDRLHLRRVRRLIRRFGIDQRVVFTGYVPAGEMRTWFGLAEAAVLPYTRIEQSGVANLAAAAGTPVLASRVGGLVQEGSDPRWSYPASDPRQLASVLEDFLTQPGAREQAAGEQPPAPELSAVVRTTIDLYRAKEELDVQYA